MINNKFIRYFGIAIFGYLFFQVASYTPTHYQVLINLLVTGLIYFVSIRIFGLDPQNHWKIILGILVFGGACRFLIAIYVPTKPVSDFEFYNSWAMEFSSAGIQNVLPKNYLYPFLLSLGYRIYPDPLIGRLINGLASTFTIGIVYLLGRELLDSRMALMPALIIAFFPSEIGAVSLLGTESIATLILVLIGFIFVLGIKDKTKRRYFLITGGLICLGFHFRSSIIFYLPILVLFLLYSRLERAHKKNAFMAILAGAVIVQALLISGHSLMTGKLTLGSISSQDSFPILSGTNFEHNGAWNSDDVELYYSWPEENRDSLAQLEAYQRIKNNPLLFLRTIMIKYSVLFKDNTYSTRLIFEDFDWSLWSMPSFLSGKNLTIICVLLSQATYFAIWGFSFLSFMNKKVGIASVTILAVIVFTLLPHAILEVQPRYHHYIMPYLIIASSTGLSNMVRREISLEKSEN